MSSKEPLPSTSTESSQPSQPSRPRPPRQERASRPDSRERTPSSSSSEPGTPRGKLFFFVLLAIATALIHVFIGGAKMVYGLPCYAAFGLVGLFALVIPWRTPLGRPNWLCLLSTLALAGYALWRSSTSPVEYLARPDFYMILGALLLYLFGAIHLSTTRDRLVYLWVLLGLAVVHVLVGAIQFKEQKNFMPLPWMFRPNYEYRASGFYICPNHLAGLLEMLALFGMSIAVWGRSRPWVRIVAGYATAMCLAGLAVTGSRGGYLSVVGGMALFSILTLIVIRQVRKRWFWPLLLMVLFGASGVVGAGVWLMKHSDQLNRRLGEIYDPKNMRIHMWQAALDTHQMSPEVQNIGTGSGTYLYYGRMFRHETVQNDPQHVHCDYLELLAEYGRVGCALMAVFLLAHLWSGIRGLRAIIQTKLKDSWNSTSNEMAVVVGSLAAFGVIAAHSLIDFNLHIPANIMFVAFFFGILASPTSSDVPGAPTRWTFRWWLRLPAAATAVALLYFAIPRIEGEYYGERARVALRDRMDPEARSFAERALSLDSANPNLYYYLGEAKHNMAMLSTDPQERKRLQLEAAEHFSTGLNYFWLDLQLLLKLARTLDNLGRFDDADRVFRVALYADPNFGNVYSYYGYHYFLQRRLQRAEILYKKALSLGENVIAPHGLEDIASYRAKAANEDTEADFPIEDEFGDDFWVPGEP